MNGVLVKIQLLILYITTHTCALQKNDYVQLKAHIHAHTIFQYTQTCPDITINIYTRLHRHQRIAP